MQPDAVLIYTVTSRDTVEVSFTNKSAFCHNFCVFCSVCLQELC